MDPQEFKALLESMGGVLDSKGNYATIKNAYGEFKVNIETAEVYFKPIQCAYCDPPCIEYKQLCLHPQGSGWSSLSLTQQQLLVLAKINLFQNGQYPPEIERQIPNGCIKAVREDRRPDFNRISQYWQGQSHYATNLEEDWEIAVNYLNLLCTTFQVPKSVHDQALQLYTQAKEWYSLYNHCIEALVTAVFYISCKRSQMSLTMRELIFTPLLQKNVWLCYRQLIDIKL